MNETHLTELVLVLCSYDKDEFDFEKWMRSLWAADKSRFFTFIISSHNRDNKEPSLFSYEGVKKQLASDVEKIFVMESWPENLYTDTSKSYLPRKKKQ